MDGANSLVFVRYCEGEALLLNSSRTNLDESLEELTARRMNLKTTRDEITRDGRALE